jgi:hypothetical protein
MFLSICIVRFSKRALDLVNSKSSHLIWNKDVFSKHSSNLEHRKSEIKTSILSQK